MDHIERCEECDEIVFIMAHTGETINHPAPLAQSFTSSIDPEDTYCFYDVEKDCPHGCCRTKNCWSCDSIVSVLGLGSMGGPECECQGGTDGMCG